MILMYSHCLESLIYTTLLYGTRFRLRIIIIQLLTFIYIYKVQTGILARAEIWQG